MTFQNVDLTSPDMPAALPREPFDWILSFATFHHLPGRETRQRVLQTLAHQLAPGGVFVMSNWQFTRSARLMKRAADWARIGLAASEVEPGDYLLTWERAGKQGLRYVHLLNEAEARELCHGAGLEISEVFESDGGTGALAEYVRMRLPRA
jgi:SAM-dependent methyltransferase